MHQFIAPKITQVHQPRDVFLSLQRLPCNGTPVQQKNKRILSHAPLHIVVNDSSPFPPCSALQTIPVSSVLMVFIAMVAAFCTCRTIHGANQRVTPDIEEQNIHAMKKSNTSCFTLRYRSARHGGSNGFFVVSRCSVSKNRHCRCAAAILARDHRPRGKVA